MAKAPGGIHASAHVEFPDNGRFQSWPGDGFVVPGDAHTPHRYNKTDAAQPRAIRIFSVFTGGDNRTQTQLRGEHKSFWCADVLTEFAFGDRSLPRDQGGQLPRSNHHPLPVVLRIYLAHISGECFLKANGNLVRFLRG
jgi:hypothetical protein